VCFSVVLSGGRYLPWNDVVEDFVNVYMRPVSCEPTIYKTTEEYHIEGLVLNKYKLRKLIIFSWLIRV